MQRGTIKALGRWTGLAIAFGWAIVAGVAAGEQTAHRVYRALETIRFERKCADAEPHQVQAYAELGSEDGRVRALVLAYTRHDAVRRDDIFIGARLVAMRIEAGKDSAGAAFSLRMEARSAAARHVGTEHSHYDSNPARGEAEQRAFRTAPGPLDIGPLGPGMRAD